MRTYAWLLAMFGAGLAGSTLVQSLLEATPLKGTAVSASEPPENGRTLHLCAGGLQSALAVEVEPLRIDERALGEVMTLAVRLHSKFAHPAVVRHAVELVSDRGGQLLVPQLSAVATLQRQGESDERVFSTPEGLSDGYYQLRVTAVGRDKAEQAVQVVEVYLRVAGGRIEQLLSDDWFGHSNANMGVRL